MDDFGPCKGGDILASLRAQISPANDQPPQHMLAGRQGMPACLGDSGAAAPASGGRTARRLRVF